MEQDIYRTLMKHLGEVGIGYPQIDDFLEVLKKTITPEEAETALGLPTRLSPFEVEEVAAIACRVQKSVEETRKTLESLAEKGFLYKQETDAGTIGYAFIQIGFGLPQIFFWKGEITDKIKDIALPLAKYVKKATPQNRGTDETRFYRYIPVDKAVDHALQAVYPYDMIAEVVKKARKIAVVHCPCRQIARLLTKSQCTHSLEVCLKFNEAADFVVQRSYGREVPQEEALQIMRKAEHEGLIHFVDNCQEGIQNCCNCCSCCCWNVMPIKKRLVPRDYLMATYFLRTTDKDECIGCGQCAADCPLEIISMQEDLPVIDETVCIGCGVCLRNCPTDAAKLRKKDQNVPFRDFAAMHRKAIQETTGEKAG